MVFSWKICIFDGFANVHVGYIGCRRYLKSFLKVVRSILAEYEPVCPHAEPTYIILNVFVRDIYFSKLGVPMCFRTNVSLAREASL